MSSPRRSYRKFQLPFPTEIPREGEDDPMREVTSPSLKELEELIPNNATSLGSIDYDVENWTSWSIDDNYYVIPWPGDVYDWALFRISWDDNYGRYDWRPEVRISGVSDMREAARLMAKGLFAQWGKDLRKKEFAPYREFLEDI